MNPAIDRLQPAPGAGQRQYCDQREDQKVWHGLDADRAFLHGEQMLPAMPFVFGECFLVVLLRRIPPATSSRGPIGG
jgi:hypothetical protein